MGCRALRAENLEQKLTIRRLAAEAEQLREALTEAAKRRSCAPDAITTSMPMGEVPSSGTQDIRAVGDRVVAATTASTARSLGSAPISLVEPEAPSRRTQNPYEAPEPRNPGQSVPKIDLSRTDEISKMLDEEEVRYRWHRPPILVLRSSCLYIAGIWLQGRSWIRWQRSTSPAR